MVVYEDDDIVALAHAIHADQHGKEEFQVWNAIRKRLIVRREVLQEK